MKHGSNELLNCPTEVKIAHMSIVETLHYHRNIENDVIPNSAKFCL